MTIPSFDDLTATLDRIGVDRTGDTLSYAADGVTFADQKAHVNYRDGDVPIDGGRAIAQDMTVTSLLKVDVPDKPGSVARVQLARRVGKTYQPINVRTDQSGTGWEFELKEAAGG